MVMNTGVRVNRIRVSRVIKVKILKARFTLPSKGC